MDIQFHLYKERKIAYAISGKGACVVLIHGFCESHEMWEKYCTELAKQYTVLVFDIPGHGDSEMIGELTTMELVAELLKELLDKHNIDKAILVGHSMGGYISLAFAEKHPELVAGMLLFHSTAYADSEEKKADRARAVEVVKRNKQAYVNALIPNIFAASGVDKHKAEVEWLRGIGNTATTEGIIGALLGMSARPDRTSVLSSANFPVHFIFGKEDSILPLEKHISLIILPKVAQATVLENVGHAGFVEKEMVCLSAIKQFIGFSQEQS